LGGDDGVVGEMWTFGETDPSAIKKVKKRKYVTTIGCWASPINPVLADARHYHSCLTINSYRSHVKNG